MTSVARTAPEPPGDPLVGHLRQFGRDPLAFFIRVAREHGGVVRFRLGPKLAHLVSDPEGVKHVLQDAYKSYAKGRPYARARFAFGDGLITSDGDYWRRHRKLIQPAFHKQHFPAFTAIMAEEAAAMLDRWAAHDGALNVAKALKSLALRISARTLFTTDIERDVDVFERLFNEVQVWFTRGSRTGYLVPPTFPTPANLRLRRTVRELDARIFDMISRRRSAAERPTDVLSMLMDARDEDGSALSDVELRDEVMTLLFAAHETTASTMAWALYTLSKYPELERRVRAEIDRVKIEDLAKLDLTRRVIDETLRLYPAAPIIPREVLERDTICGCEIPAGSIVFISPYAIHRDPAHWDNPEAFDPDRFAPDIAARRHKFVYLPFVLGPRQCIGNHFALTEMLVTIPMALQRFRFALVPGMPIGARHMRFDEGMWMTLRAASEGARAPRGELWSRPQ